MTFAGLVPASLVDYPGHLAVTVFTAGCDLRCPYCHNPGLVGAAPAPRPLPADEVLGFLEARRGLVEHLCVTGGEPTMHRGLPGFLESARRMGYRVKLDTNGSRPDALAALLARGLCDYVAMDVKTRWTLYGALGGSADPRAPQRSARLIRDAAPDYEFRTTVVPGFVDRAAVLDIARAIAGARRYALQQFLPSGPLLDPAWREVRPFPDQTLRLWADEVSPLFPEPVEVRNIGPA